METTDTDMEAEARRERTLRHHAKLLSEGFKRITAWAPADVLDAARKAYPGERGGIDWTAALKAALERAGEQPSPDMKAAERKAALLGRFSEFQVEMSGFKFDREEANARR